jgi:hypothetical protein
MVIITAMMTLLAMMSLLLSAAPAHAQSSATLRGLDVYRSTVLTTDRARELFVHRITEIVVLRNQRRPASLEKAEVMRKAIAAELSKIPGIASGELTISEYFTSVEHSMYATFDIVDESDRGRLAFAPAPKRTIPDPGGLLADWKAYFELGSVLSRRGQMPVDRPDCPGFYCLWGGATPELAALQNKFVAGATAKLKELKAVLAYDADADKRGAALFVLSYGTNGEKVVESCLAALKDPSSSVRGAALNILADIINHRKDLRVDADLMIPLLDDPSVSVRGKTLGLLVPLVDDTTQRKKILAAAPRLLDILKLSEPGSHDLAYTVLGQLSKKAYDRRDFPSWAKWVAENTEGFKK